MALRLFFITLLCQISLSWGIQEGTMAFSENKRGRLMRRRAKKNVPETQVSILPDGQILEPGDHDHADDVASRSTRMGSSQIEIGSEGETAKHAIGMSQELVDPTSKDDDDEREMHPDEDFMTLGLSEEDAEKVREQRALTKAEKMVQVLDLANETDHAKASHLEHELTSGVKGANVMEEVVDMQDLVQPGAEVDHLIKAGASLTTEDYVSLERYESGNRNIQDGEEIGENNSKDGSEDVNSTLVQEFFQAAVAEEPIMTLLPLRPREDLMRMFENMLTPIQMARLQELNKTHHFFIGVKSKGPNRIPIWPQKNGRYPIEYCRGSSLSDRAWDEFKAASRDVHGVCQKLDFKEVSKGSSCKLEVKAEKDGCSALLGYDSYGRNYVNLADGNFFKTSCASKGIATHEILHALGQAHEHQRADRDDHVKIHFDNIGSTGNKLKWNFGKNDNESTVDSYDLDSIMQYGCKAFAKNHFRWSLQGDRRRRWYDGFFGHKDCLVQMGQRSGMTTQDTRQLQRMYGCQGARPSCRRRWFRCP